MPTKELKANQEKLEGKETVILAGKEERETIFAVIFFMIRMFVVRNIIFACEEI